MSETGLGIYVGVVTNLALAAMLNNGPVAQLDASTWLVVIGTWNEILGVLFVASPELAPRVERVGRRVFAWLERQRQRVENLLRRILRMPRRYHLAAASGTFTVSGNVTGLGVAGPPAGNLEERVTWVTERVVELDRRLQTVQAQVDALPERWQADIAAMRQELEGLQRELVRTAADARIQLRLIGLGYVVLGLSLALVGNLL